MYLHVEIKFTWKDNLRRGGLNDVPIIIICPSWLVITFYRTINKTLACLTGCEANHVCSWGSTRVDHATFWEQFLYDFQSVSYIKSNWLCCLSIKSGHRAYRHKCHKTMLFLVKIRSIFNNIGAPKLSATRYQNIGQQLQFCEPRHLWSTMLPRNSFIVTWK